VAGGLSSSPIIKKEARMAGLLDIAPVTDTVPVNGTDVAVGGVSAKGIVTLFLRFPELRKVVTGMEVSRERWFEIGADAIAAIIAAGCGAPGDPEHEAVAASLPAESQIDLIQAILRVTMPGGLGPFMEKLTALAKVAGGLSNTAQATKSRKPSKS
jgi:hypothetical protein